ncbi:hypothetical protein LH407_12585 [Antiquaquibacter oligotrophicus]|nr:hypothetical protein [Antiquaquibacter oligotrophicus]UDF12983.1 hypothetical protein LH407_12585 [Antiquaquibacter oligotrophicus]
MESWGDAVDEAARADLDRLLETSIRLARTRLTEAAHFDPIAIVMTDDGRILEIEQDRSGLGKHPDIESLIRTAMSHLRQVRDQARSVALIMNTRLQQERSDAVEIRLEHRAGAAATVFEPYKKATFGARIEYGTPRAFASRPLLWG